MFFEINLSTPNDIDKKLLNRRVLLSKQHVAPKWINYNETLNAFVLNFYYI